MNQIHISPAAGVTIVNTALVVSAGLLCWKLKRMAPALMLLFMMSTSDHPKSYVHLRTGKKVNSDEMEV